MTSHDIALPTACQEALAAVEAEPLDLPEAVLLHLRGCASCAETRVLWLAQEEAPVPLAPAGYFDRLPGRILGKLPQGRPTRRTRHRGLWAAAAAAILLATSAGAFWAGRANRTPLVEASLPKGALEVKESNVDAPFQERDEILDPLQSLSPEEAAALLKTIEKADSKP